MFASIGLPTSGADTAVGERERPEPGVGGVRGSPGLCVGGGSRWRARLLWWRWRMRAASLAVVSSSSILCVIRVHRVGGARPRRPALNWGRGSKGAKTEVAFTLSSSRGKLQVFLRSAETNFARRVQSGLSTPLQLSHKPWYAPIIMQALPSFHMSMCCLPGAGSVPSRSHLLNPRDPCAISRRRSLAASFSSAFSAFFIADLPLLPEPLPVLPMLPSDACRSGVRQ